MKTKWPLLSDFSVVAISFINIFTTQITTKTYLLIPTYLIGIFDKLLIFLSAPFHQFSPLARYNLLNWNNSAHFILVIGFPAAQLAQSSSRICDKFLFAINRPLVFIIGFICMFVSKKFFFKSFSLFIQFHVHIFCNVKQCNNNILSINDIILIYRELKCIIM